MYSVNLVVIGGWYDRLGSAVASVNLRLVFSYGDRMQPSPAPGSARSVPHLCRSLMQFVDSLSRAGRSSRRSGGSSRADQETMTCCKGIRAFTFAALGGHKAQTALEAQGVQRRGRSGVGEWAEPAEPSIQRVAGAHIH